MNVNSDLAIINHSQIVKIIETNNITRKKALVVEDDPLLLEVVRCMLEFMGYDALVASNGKEALDLYAPCLNEISLLLTDLIMPELGGSDLAQACRKHNPDLKIIIMSGYELHQQREQLLAQGVFHLLQKPFTFTEIERTAACALKS